MNLRNRLLATVGATALLVSSAVGVAQAADAVVVIGAGGTLSATIDQVTLSPLTFNQTASTTSSGFMFTTANDPTGNYAGWTVTVDVDPFSSAGRPDIALTNFQGTNVPTVSTNSGQTFAGSFGASGAAGPVDNGFWKGAPTSFTSGGGIPANGSTGNYTSKAPVKLTVPAGQPTGTYTSELTVNIVSGN
jgi:hypothetical protein